MMVGGKQREEWSRLSAWMSLFANCNRDPKKAPFTPTDFNPFVEAAEQEKPAKMDPKASIDALASFFGAE